MSASSTALMKKLSASVDASITQLVPMNAESRPFRANFIAPAPKDAKKLGLKTYFQ